MARLTESQLRKMVRQELRQVLSEAIQPLTDVENIKRLFYQYNMKPEKSIYDSGFQSEIEYMLKNNEQIGSEYSEEDIKEAAIELAADLGAEISASPEGREASARRRRHFERDIENPYGG
jgi:hypothetical protein